MSILALKLINAASETKAKFLDLGNCELQAIPKEIAKLKDHLEELNLSSYYTSKNGKLIYSSNWGGKNALFNDDSLDSLSFLENLTHLNIVDCNVRKNGARVIGTMKGLQYLNLADNNIEDEGAHFISELPALTYLDLGANQISADGAKFIGKILSLNTLIIEDNDLGDRGAMMLSTLTSLLTLNVGNNRIGDLGAEYISRLSSLRKLLINGDSVRNRIGPEGAEYISRLSALEELNLSNNRIKAEGAYHLSKLSGLIGLNLHYNNIDIEGAKYIAKLPYLKYLELSFNNIGDEGAEHISKLSSLKYLGLEYNKISTFNPVTQNCLKSLNLRNNLIKDISEDLIKNTTLNVFVDKKNTALGIDLFENPINSPPIEVIVNGREAILDYFESELKQLNECKLIFVGNGGVGKTSLMKRLVYGIFDKEEKITHGINKIAWKGFKNEKGESIKLNLWDFGGQHIQQSLHQFFFSERVIYVLVLNPRNDQNANYWLDLINKLGPHSQLIIVYNWRDEKDIESDFLGNYQELRKTYGYLPEPIILSCATNSGMEEFKTVVRNAVLTNSGLKTKYPEVWFNIKEKLEKRIPIGKHYVKYEEYETWCAEEGYNDPDRKRNLLRILNSVGAIVFFDKPILNELQVLNPEWISTGAYAILTSPITKSKKGHLLWDDLRSIFSTKKEIFSDGDLSIDYKEDQFKFILQLMLDYRLCQRNPIKEETEFLIPAAFGEKPDKTYDVSGGRHYRFRFQAPFEMLIIHRFIAKNIPNIVSNDYWGSGIYFKHATSNTFALVETNLYSEEINCRIKGENIRGMWEVIRNDFREIFNMYHNFAVEEEVEYEAGNEIVFLKYNDMVRALKNGIQVIPYDPQTGLKDINVLEVLELFEHKQPTISSMASKSIKIEVNPTITVNPQFVNNPPAPPEEAKAKNASPATFDKEAEDKIIRRWKNKALIVALFSAAITVLLVLCWINKWLLQATTWQWLEDNQAIKWLSVIIGLVWTAFILKSLYDRFLDPSKEKAKRESWRK